ncbi:hypothetical protein K490DRAFT_69073 [Saccharata proteae CBS 121410]|uniref:Uncharacterized protein n=1 Tax=Saccharata proteae CBS 121410 TaxID=1314787 RepID=A0A9P4LS35_9PEZI|nr:hypothetical protein K490DRAFT_69073 [Saccharata proteae CBS 121410]
MPSTTMHRNIKHLRRRGSVYPVGAPVPSWIRGTGFLQLLIAVLVLALSAWAMCVDDGSRLTTALILTLTTSTLSTLLSASSILLPILAPPPSTPTPHPLLQAIHTLIPLTIWLPTLTTLAIYIAIFPATASATQHRLTISLAALSATQVLLSLIPLLPAVRHQNPVRPGPGTGASGHSNTSTKTVARLRGGGGDAYAVAQSPGLDIEAQGVDVYDAQYGHQVGAQNLHLGREGVDGEDHQASTTKIVARLRGGGGDAYAVAQSPGLDIEAQGVDVYDAQYGHRVGVQNPHLGREGVDGEDHQASTTRLGSQPTASTRTTTRPGIQPLSTATVINTVAAARRAADERGQRQSIASNTSTTGPSPSTTANTALPVLGSVPVSVTAPAPAPVPGRISISAPSAPSNANANNLSPDPSDPNRRQSTRSARELRNHSDATIASESMFQRDDSDSDDDGDGEGGWRRLLCFGGRRGEEDDGDDGDDEDGGDGSNDPDDSDDSSDSSSSYPSSGSQLSHLTTKPAPLFCAPLSCFRPSPSSPTSSDDADFDARSTRSHRSFRSIRSLRYLPRPQQRRMTQASVDTTVSPRTRVRRASRRVMGRALERANADAAAEAEAEEGKEKEEDVETVVAEADVGVTVTADAVDAAAATVDVRGLDRGEKVAEDEDGEGGERTEVVAASVAVAASPEEGEALDSANLIDGPGRASVEEAERHRHHHHQGEGRGRIRWKGSSGGSGSRSDKEGGSRPRKAVKVGKVAKTGKSERERDSERNDGKSKHKTRTTRTTRTTSGSSKPKESRDKAKTASEAPSGATTGSRSKTARSTRTTSRRDEHNSKRTAGRPRPKKNSSASADSTATARDRRGIWSRGDSIWAVVARGSVSGRGGGGGLVIPEVGER